MIQNLIGRVISPLHLFILIAGFILTTAVLHQCQRIEALSGQIQTSQSNLQAVTSQLETYETETAQPRAERGAQQEAVSHLQQQNQNLYDELSHLEDHKTIKNIGYIIERDTLRLSDVIVDDLGDSLFQIGWTHNLQGDWGARELHGASQVEIQEG